MAKNNLHTPDQDINPPDDDHTKECVDCKGTGKIYDIPEDDEDFIEAITITCPTCKGEGQVEKDDDDEEW